MGDRTTPMKFGPEWLRNLSREPTTSPGSGAGGGAPTTPPIRPVVIATASSNTTTPPNTSKVLLAKLRYGREEMLALYDRQNVEAPSQLKTIELLYQPRGKPPYALNNNFEDDTRDINMRNNPPISGVSPCERYGQGRGRGVLTITSEGRGRATNLSENRGKARGFVRQTSKSTIWHNASLRSYPGAPDDDPNPPRMWNNGVGMNPPGIRPSVVDQADWANKAPYRKNRQNHTNWRQQQNRDEGEEWRSSDSARRGQEKREREWPERNSQEKSWAPNRRQWSGDNNEDALPEWAVENSEACGGTFDSSGAFHGYSNDDSNLPKVQESTNPLARSHTHGSFSRSKTAEEGSEEWWASEKAKKLSAKRFDATEVKFKKQVTPGISEENASANPSPPTSNSGAKTGSGQTRDRPKVEVRSRSASSPTPDYSPELQDEAAALPAKREELKHDEDKFKERNFQTNYSENTKPSVKQRIDMLLRAEEIESSKERGNFKSVMMSPNNNNLRQKHQNIGTPTNGIPKRIAIFMENATERRTMMKSLKDSNDEDQQIQNETKLVEDLLDMNLNEELQAQLVNAETQAAGMSNPISSQGMQMMMNSPMQNMVMNQQNPTLQSSQPMPQGTAMRPIGITNSLLNASLGLPIGTGSNMGMPLPNMPPSPITNPGMLSSSLQGMANNMQSTMQGMQATLQQQSTMQGMQATLQQSGMQSGMQGMQSGMQGLQSGMQGMQSGMQGMQSGMQGMQSGMQGPCMQGNGFLPNSMPGNMQSAGMNNNLQPGSGMSGYQGVSNSSLFMQGSSNTMQNPSELQQGLYPLHGHSLQQSASQGSFSAAAMYGNMIQQPTAGPLPNIPLTEQWYYEDPKKTIQGPFTTKEMCNWYHAGFFSPDLMVRRACETGLRPLITYGVLPFGPLDLMHPSYNQLAGRFDIGPQSHNGMINQQGLGPEHVYTIHNLATIQNSGQLEWFASVLNPVIVSSSGDPRAQIIQLSQEINVEVFVYNIHNLARVQNSGQMEAFASVLNPVIVSSSGDPRAQIIQLSQEVNFEIVESLWSQPSNDMMWVQQPATPRDDNNGINISMYVWEQPSGMSNSLLPDAKDMKTEDEILAQMRASQAEAATQNLTFMSDAISPDDVFTAGTNIAPNLEELQKLIESDIHGSSARTTAIVEAPPAVSPGLQRPRLASDKDKKTIPDHIPEVSAKQQGSSKALDTKPAKQPTKVEDKPKAKDVTITKAKGKKPKDDKREDPTESKMKEEDKKNAEKRSGEPSPPKNKKDDKVNKKELEKEKKEWLKDGFTIVKGAEKKDNKKKEREEARAAEEAEKKRKEEEKRALLEAEKNKTPEPVTRRQQMEIGQTQRQQAQVAIEQAPKKAPWSAPAAGRDGLALSDIQRLEREKKLEQMKEQQQMLQVIAQQQAAAAQREQQELQAGQPGWAKKKQSSNSPGQTLAEIQAEARLQAAAIAAAATAAAREEVQPTPPPVNVTPWGATNGGGFWDSPSSNERAAPSSAEPTRPDVKPAEAKPKKRVTVLAPPKKEPSAAADFETWCTNVLSNWKDAANIDIPTFIAFLRDIESPYEVKDYVKCYLGDTKESNDFARQFLERRSRMLRVGMVTPSDDLCSPAAAINPRTNSGSDYTEVKSKGKKTKKNKMFKVDARILGFSVTASEDRINIGDIDTV